MESFVLWCLVTLITPHQGSLDDVNFVEIQQTNLFSVLLYV